MTEIRKPAAVKASVIACSGLCQKRHLGGVAAEGPLLGPVVGLEIVSVRPCSRCMRVVDEGMVDGGDESAAGLQDAPQLGQGCLPVLQVMQHQGRDDVVESAVGEGQRVPRSATCRSASAPSRWRASASIAGLESMAVTTAPRSRSAADSGPEPQPASRIRRPATSPARFRIAGRA